MENAIRIVCILRCFFLVSGLKINLKKSKLIGFGVASFMVEATITLVGCGAATLHFVQLGITVGHHEN